jgi:hypothetical protein
MTEYYTTTQLGIAYFALLHKFEGIETLTGSIQEKWRVVRYWQDGKAWRFPKTPHNLAIMEPIVGDYVQAKFHAHIGGTISRITGDRLWLSFPFTADDETGVWKYRDDMFCMTKKTAIIMLRNNQLFPVWDKEKV